MNCESAQPETDFRWERKPHPMCIPHIVDSILAYLSVPDLKSCRLVSSQYNEIACKALQNEETITFKNISQLETYLFNIKPISVPSSRLQRRPRRRFCSSSSSLCSTLSSSSTDYSFYDCDDKERGNASEGEKSGTEDDEWPLIKQPHGWYEDGRDDEDFCFSVNDNGLYRYSHRSFHFHYFDPSEEIEPFDQFFQTFGPQIQRLKYTTDLLPYNFPKTLGHMGEVWQDRLPNLEELILEMKWGVPAHLFANLGADQDVRRRYPRVLLPSLRKLHLDVLLTDRDADRAELFLQQLFSVTPNIEEISIPGSKRFFDDYINVVLARVIMASDVPHLSTLNFCLALSDAQMRLLTDKGLPLSTLILDLEDLQFEAGEGEGENVNPDENGDVEDDNLLHDDDEIRHEFLRQNQNRRPSFTPISRGTLQRFLKSISSTLSSLHICFPQSPRHPLHAFKFQEDMTELKFLALGYFAGSSKILDQLPALKKLELWNSQFRDCKVVPDKYQQITSMIS